MDGERGSKANAPIALFLWHLQVWVLEEGSKRT